MTEPKSNRPPRRLPRWLWLIPLLPIALIVIHFGKKSEGDEAYALFTVQQGPLTISVTERGAVENREKEIVKSTVAGRTTVVSLVDEGTFVKKGDLLVELDSSAFEEERIEQEIRVQNSEAALIQAQESLAITRNQTEADTEEADRNVRFAALDLNKYQEGDYPMSLQNAESQITLANEELRNAEDRYAWSTNLAARGYITQIELVSDELAMKRKRIDLETALKSRDVLVQYQHDRDIQELESAVKQANMAKERTTRKARADIVKAEADLRARESEHARQKSKLEKLLGQIRACHITAPANGMVVYASSGQGRRYRGGEPLKVGSEVTERQELIHLPTSENMNVSIRVQESSLRKVSVGQKVHVMVDAVPGRVYRGVLSDIPLLPDATRAWLNPDLKIYDCEAELEDGVKDLRPGMSCRAEIIVSELPDAIFVPVQCILRVRNQPTAYVYANRRVEPRAVKIGMDNGRMIHILDGLTPGEQVLLAPPLNDASVAQSMQEDAQEPAPDRLDQPPIPPVVEQPRKPVEDSAPDSATPPPPGADRAKKRPRAKEGPPAS